MLRSFSGPGRPAVAFALAAFGLAACGSQPARLAGPALPSLASAGAHAAAQPYQLYTHCGIDDARIGDRYFEAVHPLSDGQGNPPPGWGNPYQPGTMTTLSPTTVVFRDRAGHRVQFRLRPGATRFLHVCS
jgi:hypothetical protein